MKLVWNKPTHRGLFLRAEDFFGYVKNLSRTRSELENTINEINIEYQDRSSFAQGLARMPYVRELKDIEQRYEDELDQHSHGESYPKLFQSRFVPGGLYLLDEPEAALSPLSQLGFLSSLKEMVAQNAQFIISTHFPILMAIPGAMILCFDFIPIQSTAWDQLEHVTLTRDFLNSPHNFLRLLQIKPMRINLEIISKL